MSVASHIKGFRWLLIFCDPIPQWFPTFFDAFLLLLSWEVFIPPLLNFYSSPVRVCRLVLTTIGTIVFIVDIT